MAYRNPIEDFLGGAFRAVLGPILAPFLLLAMGLAHITTPWLVQHHYLSDGSGNRSLEIEDGVKRGPKMPKAATLFEWLLLAQTG